MEVYRFLTEYKNRGLEGKVGKSFSKVLKLTERKAGALMVRVLTIHDN